nr:Protein of unknown function DUF229 domain containing protein [Haemonchus contortus]
MVTRFRIRQLVVIATVVVSLIFIFNAYSVNEAGEEAIHSPPFLEKELDVRIPSRMEKKQNFVGMKKPLTFDFKIIVTGQDSDRKNQGREKSAGNAASSIRDHECQIPKLDINGAEVKSFFFKSKPLQCDKNPANWVYIDDNGHVQYIEGRKNAECLGSYVTRKNDNENSNQAFDSLPSGKPLASDFAVVHCRQGMESCRRKMPKTVEVLEKSLGAVVLNGYNIVGDGTPQAFIPILTASTEEELPLTRKRFRNANYVDDVYPFIWNNFSSAGYVTLYGEDAFAIGTFTYRLKGFRNQPTDHYTRPIFKEYEREGGNCLGSEPLHKSGEVAGYSVEINFKKKW